jgi:hypothetical protein
MPNAHKIIKGEISSFVWNEIKIIHFIHKWRRNAEASDKTLHLIHSISMRLIEIRSKFNFTEYFTSFIVVHSYERVIQSLFEALQCLSSSSLFLLIKYCCYRKNMES